MRASERWVLGVVAVTAAAALVALVWIVRNRQTVSTPTLAVEGSADVIDVTLPPLERPAERDATSSGTPVTQPDTDPTTHYVSPGGSDDNDGQTADTPWQNLQASLDRLEPGDTLFLMDGRYNELTYPDWAHFTVRVDGTPEEWIRVAAAPGHEPVIAPTSANGLLVESRYVEVSGLTITGEGFDADNSYGWGIHVRETHHVRLIDNVVSNMPVGGITAVESTNVEVYRNEVFDNSFWGTEQGSGISFWHAADHDTEPFEDGYHDKIVGNVIYRNENRVFSEFAPGQDLISDGNGIIIDETTDTGYTGRFLVANNIIFDNGGRAVMVNVADRVDIVFNTTYRNGRTTDLAGGPVELAVARARDVQILNNLAWARDGLPSVQIRESDDVAMGGNLFVTSAPSGLETELDVVTTDDPLLVAPTVDPMLADFRPLATSPAIDVAIETPLRITFDADGNVRPTGSADVGAYELLVDD